ncbi:MAG: hypothetical protein JKY67_20185 [Pseudomonadales bacterium]|nr:hypothetical protein [Pseudomonadales bacterium]
MKSIWMLFWDICLFRRGPEDVPDSRFLVSTMALVFLLFNTTARLFLLESSLFQSLMSSVLVLCVFAAGLWLGLKIKGGLNRFEQSMTALLGQDMVISILSLPLLLLLVAQQQQGAQPQVSSILLLIFYVWDLAVKGFICKKALGVGPVLAFMLAFALVMGAIMLDKQLFYADSAIITSHDQSAL